jgi:hypothetical protein
MASMLAAAMVISVRALPRQDKLAFVSVEYGGELDQRQLTLLGLDKMDLRPAQRGAVQVELSLEPICGGKHGHGHGVGEESAGQPAEQEQQQEQVLSVSVAKTYAAGSEVGGDETLDQEPGAVEDDMGAAGSAGPDGAVDSGALEGADYGKRGLRVEVKRGTAAAVYAAFSAERLHPGQYQLVHLVEHSQGKVLGGVSYVVVQPPRRHADQAQQGEQA